MSRTATAAGALPAGHESCGRRSPRSLHALLRVLLLSLCGGALLVSTVSAGAAPPKCNQQVYHKTWFGESDACGESPWFPGVHTCVLDQAFYCGNGQPASDLTCLTFREASYCALPACGYEVCQKPYDGASECAARGQEAESCGTGGQGNDRDDNFDGCADEGCTGGAGECTCKKSCAVPTCNPPAKASCSVFNFKREICGNGKDDNCSGTADEGCSPKDSCPAKAGKDPILLHSQAAVTEPFTDFEVQFVSKLGLTRTYNSSDASVVAEAHPGVFGRGWHHDWEAELRCSPDGTCVVSRGLLQAIRFQSAGSALSLDGTETVDVYSPLSTDVLPADHHHVLIRRPSGRWQLFLSDGTTMAFEAITGTSSCPDAEEGVARVVSIGDVAGNEVAVQYDRAHGVLLRLDDGLGHSLELRGAGACPTTATELRFGGRTVARYAYTGGNLSTVRDADGQVMRSYTYDATGRLIRSVRNGAGELVAEFSYDGQGRAIGLEDYGSSVSIDYDAPGGIAVTEAYHSKDGPTSVTSTRVLNQDGKLVSSSEGCACGPARTQEWNDGQLTCSMDALGHVTRNEYDGLGRVTHRVEFPGTSCTVPATLPPESSEEYRRHDLTRPIAEGVSLSLDVTTRVSRWTRTTASGWAHEESDYNQAPNPAIDPPGYACTASPLPAGSVVCRTIETGFVLADPGAPLRLDRHATFYSYDGRGRLVRTYGRVSLDLPGPDDVPPLEERTYWADDEALPRRGRLHEVKRYPRPGASPLVTAYDYDELGAFQITDERGGVTTIVKDARGRPLFVLSAAGGVNETRYHDGTSPRLTLEAGAGAVRYTYDPRGRVQRLEHLDGDPEVPGATPVVTWSEHYAYDAAGNRIHAERRDREGRVTWREDRAFDVQHRVVWESNPDHPETGRTWAYDESGALRSSADEIGRRTSYVHDARGRVQRVERSSPTTEPRLVAAYTYLRGAESPSRVDGDHGELKGEYGTATYAHDDFGRPYELRTSSLLFGSQHHRYDARGNLVFSRKTHFRNGTQEDVQYTYDGLDRLTSMTAGTLTYRYVYDAPPYQGLLTSVEEPGRSVTYEYDAAGRMISEEVHEPGASQPLVTGYAYDTAGRVAQITYPSGLSVRYERDPATGEVVRVSNAETGTRYADAIERVPSGRVEALTFGNGAQFRATFNLRQEPTSWSSGPLHLTYGTNPAGDVVQIADRSLALDGTARDVSREFTYDVHDRLSGSAGWLQYFHDRAGNRAYEIVTGPIVSWNYRTMSGLAPLDQVHRREQSGRTTHMFVYDGAGRTTAIGDWWSSSAPVVCLLRDALGRLEGVGKGNTRADPGYGAVTQCTPGYSLDQVLVRYRYDAANRRVGRQDVATGRWIVFVHDAAGQLLSERALVDGRWTNVRDYVWVDGVPLAQIEYPGPTEAEGRAYYFHTDHIGLPRAMTNAAGTLVWSTEPRPYGDLVEQTTTDPLSGRVVVTNLRLPGQYDERLLGPVGLQGPYYNWNRWYLPGVGRYLEPDPLALDGEFNSDYGVDWYNYASGNPLKYTDPFGLFTKDKTCLNLPKETDVIKAADAVTDVNLKQCILKQNERAHLGCPDKEDPECCDNERAPGACAAGPGTCKVTWCNRTKQTCSANILVHEFAHNCGWNHKGGKGVPYNGGVMPGSCNL